MTPIAPLLKLARDGQLLPALRANALFGPFYQVIWLAAAKRTGVLARLAGSAMRRGEMGALHGVDGIAVQSARWRRVAQCMVSR